MSIRQALPYALLLVVFLIWLYLKPQQQLEVLPEHHPSYIAYNISSDHFDETGMITHQVHASKATSYSDKEITIFENPKVLMYVQNEQENSITTWQVTSED